MQQAYGSAILSLPLIPVRSREGHDFSAGLRILREVISRRARQAELTPEEIFEAPELFDRFCRLSGGHVPSLFVLLRSAIERCDQLPINQEVIDRTVRRGASDVALPLRSREWRALREIHRTKAPVDNPEDAELWHSLLRGLFVFTYQDELGIWYDWNPLLEEAPEGMKR